MPSRFHEFAVGAQPQLDPIMVKLYEFNAKNLRKLNTMSAYTRRKAKSKYRNRIRLERASQKKYRDTHKTPHDRVKRCRERKINIKASERVKISWAVEWPRGAQTSRPAPADVRRGARQTHPRRSEGKPSQTANILPTSYGTSDAKPANSWHAPVTIAGPEVVPLTSNTLAQSTSPRVDSLRNGNLYAASTSIPPPLPPPNSSGVMGPAAMLKGHANLSSRRAGSVKEGHRVVENTAAKQLEIVPNWFLIHQEELQDANTHLLPPPLSSPLASIPCPARDLHPSCATCQGAGEIYPPGRHCLITATRISMRARTHTHTSSGVICVAVTRPLAVRECNPPPPLNPRSPLQFLGPARVHRVWLSSCVGDRLDSSSLQPRRTRVRFPSGSSPWIFRLSRPHGLAFRRRSIPNSLHPRRLSRLRCQESARSRHPLNPVNCRRLSVESEGGERHAKLHLDGFISSWVHRQTPYKVLPTSGGVIVPITVPPGGELRRYLHNTKSPGRVWLCIRLRLLNYLMDFDAPCQNTDALLLFAGLVRLYLIITMRCVILVYGCDSRMIVFRFAPPVSYPVFVLGLLSATGDADERDICLLRVHCRNEGKGGKREIPEETRRPAASSDTIPTCELPGIEPVSPGWEASSLTTTPPWPLGAAEAVWVAATALRRGHPGSIPNGVELDFRAWKTLGSGDGVAGWDAVLIMVALLPDIASGERFAAKCAIVRERTRRWARVKFGWSFRNTVSGRRLFVPAPASSTAPDHYTTAAKFQCRDRHTRIAFARNPLRPSECRFLHSHSSRHKSFPSPAMTLLAPLQTTSGGHWRVWSCLGSDATMKPKYYPTRASVKPVEGRDSSAGNSVQSAVCASACNTCRHEFTQLLQTTADTEASTWQRGI
ncbi:hypothetical protein PR048_031457 [Dryococelus australis]|uniref:CCT domain-containing protein n=1 Tax=Dryococelus australis TaxID=614101 RepID=A0ABQ9G5A8_9NEOP|nr:hypothetical protein PR048_031457 [Dryococelus australis]